MPFEIYAAVILAVIGIVVAFWMMRKLRAGEHSRFGIGVLAIGLLLVLLLALRASYTNDWNRLVNILLFRSEIEGDQKTAIILYVTLLYGIFLAIFAGFQEPDQD